jgi:hypothetical protein
MLDRPIRLPKLHLVAVDVPLSGFDGGLSGQCTSKERDALRRACKLGLYTHGFRCAPAQNEHDAGKGSPPPHHSTGKRPVKTAERQIKVAGKYVIGRGKAGAKGVDVAYYTRMEPTNSIEGKHCRQIDDFAR